MIALLLVLLASQPAAEERGEEASVTPRVLILPAVTRDKLTRGEPLDSKNLRAFSDAFRETAADLFGWRRWEIVPPEEISVLTSKLGFGAICSNSACVNALVKETGATHWLSAVVIRADARDCRARTALFDVAREVTERVAEDDIAPCVAQNILAKAEDLGRRMAEGPRLAPKIALDLTPLEVPAIDIPDIADVAQYQTSTAARSASAFPLERALEVYRAQAMLFFEDAAGQYYVARDGRLLDDCEVLKVASLPVTAVAAEHCDGNLWELAWIAMPVGALGLIPSFVTTSEGGSPIPMLLSGALFLGGPLAALLLNVDAAEPSRGEHILRREELARIVADTNAALRRSLALSDADVQIAGLTL